MSCKAYFIVMDVCTHKPQHELQITFYKTHYHIFLVIQLISFLAGTHTNNLLVFYTPAVFSNCCITLLGKKLQAYVYCKTAHIYLHFLVCDIFLFIWTVYILKKRFISKVVDLCVLFCHTWYMFFCLFEPVMDFDFVVY